MTDSQLSRQETTDLLWEMMGHLVDGDPDTAASILERIANNTTTQRMYGVCCGIAEFGAAALRKAAPPGLASGHFWAIQELVPGGLDANPTQAWAGRFLVAHANGDHATTDALYSTAVHSGGDQYGASVCDLAMAAASVIRAVLDAKDGK